MELTLYTGQGCCLCEQAEKLLYEVNSDIASCLIKVDVRSSTDFYHLYGARIPVLFRADNQQELPWPFDQFQLVEFLH